MDVSHGALESDETMVATHNNIAVILAAFRKRNHKAILLTSALLVITSLLSRVFVSFDGSSAALGRFTYINNLQNQFEPTLRAPYNQYSYYIALNLFNNAEIIPQLHDQLLIFASLVGEENVYVSVFENGMYVGTPSVLVRPPSPPSPPARFAGSKDLTPTMLAQLRRSLEEAGVRNHIQTGGGDWKRFCPEIIDSADRDACFRVSCSTLRNCPETVRIPVMAAIRNMALLPLLNKTSLSEAAEDLLRQREEAFTRADMRRMPLDHTIVPHLGLTRPVQVLFLNDVIVYAEDMLKLVGTADGNYDMACAMDFELLKFYDTWVARDMSGSSFDDWYPYVREATAQRLLREGKEFRVFSCWNGAVVIPASRILHDGILFRSWMPDEQRALNADSSAAEVFRPRTCPASECQLICKDLWQAGHPRIFMNPTVRLLYNQKSEQLQRVLMRVVNTLLLSWSNRIERSHHLLRSPWIATTVGSEVNWLDEGFDKDIRAAFPRRVSCGLAGDDSLG